MTIFLAPVSGMVLEGGRRSRRRSKGGELNYTEKTSCTVSMCQSLQHPLVSRSKIGHPRFLASCDHGRNFIRRPTRLILVKLEFERYSTAYLQSSLFSLNTFFGPRPPFLEGCIDSTVYSQDSKFVLLPRITYGHANKRGTILRTERIRAPSPIRTTLSKAAQGLRGNSDKDDHEGPLSRRNCGDCRHIHRRALMRSVTVTV